ncbi:hypothetical protein L195_g037351, partial [Trifolium pratense]
VDWIYYLAFGAFVTGIVIYSIFSGFPLPLGSGFRDVVIYGDEDQHLLMLLKNLMQSDETRKQIQQDLAKDLWLNAQKAR